MFFFFFFEQIRLWNLLDSDFDSVISHPGRDFHSTKDYARNAPTAAERFFSADKS